MYTNGPHYDIFMHEYNMLHLPSYCLLLGLDYNF